MKLGIVPYLNAFPLVYGLECEKFVAPPAQLSQMARSDDILLAPIVTAFMNPGWYLLDECGIGSFGPVETVKLFFRGSNITIQNLKSIYLDKESLTSISLLKILLKNFHSRHLNEISFSDKMEGCESALFIGDKVWNFQGPKSLDLGQAWTQFTTLPFVYACWMTRSQETGKKWKKNLEERLRKNLETLPSLVSKAPQNHCPNLLKYWQNLKYDIDAQAKKGIELFQKMWCELENKPYLPLNWL